MTSLPDLIYVAMFALVGPFVDYAKFWPAQRRLAEVDPAFVRRWIWKSAVFNPWMLVAFGVSIWMANGRDWAWLGFTWPQGRALWIAIAFVALPALYYAYAIATLARSAEARASPNRIWCNGCRTSSACWRTLTRQPDAAGARVLLHLNAAPMTHLTPKKLVCCIELGHSRA